MQESREETPTTRNGIMTILLALIMAVSSLPAAVMGEPVTVIATSYSCDNHPDNRMFPCGQTRWGYDPLQPGAACPTTWAHRTLYIERIGIRRCDDTGRHDYLTVGGYTRPHIDARMGFDEAVQWGIQTTSVWILD